MEYRDREKLSPSKICFGMTHGHGEQNCICSIKNHLEKGGFSSLVVAAAFL